MSSPQQVLRELLTERISLDELKTFCFDLEIDYEILDGTNKKTKLLSLVSYLAKRQKLNLLVEHIRQKRPDIELPDEKWDAIRFVLSDEIASGAIEGKYFLSGAKPWNEWKAYQAEYIRFPFITDENRKGHLQEIKDTLIEPRSIVRVIGLSGLGKTRLAFEAFKPVHKKDFTHEQIVYINAKNSHTSLPARFSDWIRQGYSGIVIVDNCDLELHQELSKEVKRTDSFLSLLTLDFNPEIRGRENVIILKPVQHETIKKILEPIYGDIITDLDRIIRFAQGFPQMAVLLADARLDERDDVEMGSLQDDILVNRLLWVNNRENTQQLNMVRACSLFDRFGWDGEAEIELQFIAEKIAKVKPAELRECVYKFQKRGIIDVRGRYAQLVPKPLAIRLAADWWRFTSPRHTQEIVLSEMPGKLLDNFCYQIAKLDFLPETKKLTEKLCGSQGPFGQAEVLKSAQGSKLFRYLVEVNPNACNDALFRVFKDTNHDQLLEIKGEVRRNLVRALEKLCFRLETFPKATQILAAFAIAENETWSNNATGQFLQLFHIFLSGTQAPLDMRFRVIDALLQRDNLAHTKVAIEALSHAIKAHHFSRGVGAEYQGSQEPLEEWRPKMWQEVFDYWEQALSTLTRLACSEGIYASDAKNSIADNLRGLIQYGRIEAIDRAIKLIVENDGSYWPEALTSIHDAKIYDSDQIPSEGIRKIDEWIELLQPEVLSERLKLTISTPPYIEKIDEHGKYQDLSEINARELGFEVGTKTEELLSVVHILLTGEQRYGYVFGLSVAERTGNLLSLISKSLEKLKLVDRADANVIFINALLNYLQREELDKWEKIIRELSNDNDLVIYLPDLIRSSHTEIWHLDLLYDLVASNQLDLTIFRKFSRQLDHLDAKNLLDILKKIRDFDKRGPWVILKLIYMYQYHNDQKWVELDGFLRKTLLVAELNNASTVGRSDLYEWYEITKKLLENDSECQFASTFTKNLISYLSYDDSSTHQRYFKLMIKELLAKCGRYVWPLFSEVIEEKGVGKFILENTLSVHNEENSILSLPHDYLWSWCKNNPSFAPQFFAKAIDIVVVKNGQNALNPLARKLIDEFGNQEDVLNNLLSFMGVFSWSGSIVPHYKAQKDVLAALANHPNPNVQIWVSGAIDNLERMIKQESLRDEESEWGIY